MQAEKEAQVGVDLSSLERVQREAAADRTQLEGELRRLRGEHSNLQVFRLEAAMGFSQRADAMTAAKYSFFVVLPSCLLPTQCISCSSSSR